jgi:hypothetical protein
VSGDGRVVGRSAAQLRGCRPRSPTGKCIGFLNHPFSMTGAISYDRRGVNCLSAKTPWKRIRCNNVEGSGATVGATANFQAEDILM